MKGRAFPGMTFPERTAGAVAIEHVTLVPMDSNRLVRDQTVVFEDGTIRRIGASSSVHLDNVRAIDGRGRYLVPGLADMHVHYWDPTEFGLFLANGVTRVRNMWGAPMHLALRQRLDQGLLPGPHVTTTSPLIDGPGDNGQTIWPGSPLLTRREDAEDLVRTFAERGYQQIKAYQWLRLDTLRALCESARRYGLRVTGHCPDGATFEDAIDAGMTCFEHLTGIASGHLDDGSSLPVVRDRSGRRGGPATLRHVAEHLDLEAIRRLAGRLAEQQIWNCPTTVVWHSGAQAPRAAMADPRLRYVPEPQVRAWNPANDFRSRDRAGSEEEWLAAQHARNDAYLRVVGILYAAGAPLLLGTDTPNPFVVQGFSIHRELASLVEAGLSPYAALRTGTSEAARFLGESAIWGTIEVGKRADLLLVDANPLDDVGAVRSPRSVFVNSFEFSRSDLDALLEQRAALVREPSLASTVFPELSALGGTLVERTAGALSGRVGFRHQRLEDGGWLVEERQASTYAGNTLRTVRLWLGARFAVERAEYELETALGVESGAVARGSDGYRLQVTELDGHVASGSIPETELVPSERMAASVLPKLLTDEPPRTRTLLGLNVEGGVARVAPMEISPLESDAWQVRVQRPGQTTRQTYQFDADGGFVGMEEMTWRGLRALRPEELDEPARAD